jgi:hypothetical protein
MELHEGVVLVQHGSIPSLGDQPHEPLLGRCCIGAWNQVETLCHAKMVAIDTERSASQGREVDDCATGFGPDSGKLLKPCSNFVRAIFGEKAKR